MDKHNYIVGIGEVLWDILPEGKKIGGAPANFAYHVSQFGLHSKVVSAIGKDKLGSEIIDNFKNKRLEKFCQYKILDVKLRQGFYTKDILCNSLERCNVLKINDEELVILSRLFGYPGIDLQDKCWNLLAEYKLKILILTCGVNGSYVFTPGNISFVETPKVEIADTVGAGDSFTATFIAAILKGKSINEAHKLAVDVSAYVCTKAGAMPKISTELLSKL